MIHAIVLEQHIECRNLDINEEGSSDDWVKEEMSWQTKCCCIESSADVHDKPSLRVARMPSGTTGSSSTQFPSVSLAFSSVFKCVEPFNRPLACGYTAVKRSTRTQYEQI